MLAERLLGLLARLLDHVTSLSTAVATADADDSERPAQNDVDNASGEQAAQDAEVIAKEKRQHMLAGWILFACKFVSGALQVVAIEETEVQAMLSAFVSLDQSL